MEKVIVIGCPGSGKSTFARKLSEVTGLALYHLDMLYWNADKTTVSRDVFSERLGAVLQKPSWIIDGNYQRTMELRIKACDTILFLDYPTQICLEGIESRKGKPRPDMPWVEGESIDAEFVSFVEKFNTEIRPGILALLKQYASKNIVIFRGREDAEVFLEKLKTEGDMHEDKKCKKCEKSC